MEKQLSSKVQLATAVGLAVQAEKSTLIDKRPEQSLLLAIEAIRAMKSSGHKTSVPENALLKALANSGGLVFGGHDEESTDIAISADGHWLVTNAAGEKGRKPLAHLWDLTAPGAGPIPLEGALPPFKITPNDRWVVTGSGDSTVRLWNLSKRNEGPISLGSGRINAFTCAAGAWGIDSACVSADSHWLISAASGESVVVWDLTLDNPAAGSHKPVPGQYFAISSNGRWLVTGSGNPCKDLKTYLWDLLSNDPHAGVRALDSLAKYASFSADNELLATAGGCYGKNSVERVLVWKPKEPSLTSIPLDGKTPTDEEGHALEITGLAISPDHSRVIVQTSSTSYLWHIKQDGTPEKSHKELAHPGIEIEDSFWSSNSEWLFGFGKEKGSNYKVWSWDVTRPSPQATIRPVLDASGEEISSAEKPHVSEDMHWIFLFNGLTAIVLDLTQEDPVNSSHVLVGHDARIHSGDWKPNVAVTESQDGTIRLWNLTRKRAIASPIALPDNGNRSPDGRWLVISSEPEKAADLWDLGSAEAIRLRLPQSQNVDLTSLHFSADKRWLVGIGDGTPKLWDLSSPRAAPRLLEGSSSVDSKLGPSANFTEDSRWLLTTQGGIAQLWSLASAQATARPVSLGKVKSFKFSPDGHWLFAISEDDGTLTLRNLTTPAAAPRPWPDINSNKDPKRPTGATFSPDGGWLLTTQASVAQLWNLASAQATVKPVPLGKVKNVKFSPDGHWLFAISGDDGTPTLRDLTTPAAAPLPWPDTNINKDPKRPTGATFSPDGGWLLTTQGGIAQLWSLASAQATAKPVPLGKVKNLEFSPDGHWLFAISVDDGTPTLRNLTTPAAAPRPWPDINKDPKRPIEAMFSGDSRWLLTTQAGVAQLWSLASGQATAKPVSLGKVENSVNRFSPDGRWLITISEKDNTAKLWDLSSITPAMVRLPESPNGEWTPGFDQESRWLIAIYHDNDENADENAGRRLRIWKLPGSTSRVISSPIDLPTLRLQVGSVLISPGGQWVTSESSGPMLLWRMGPEKDIISLACQTAGRNLSAHEWKEYFGDEPYHKTCAELPVGKDVQEAPTSESPHSKRTQGTSLHRP